MLREQLKNGKGAFVRIKPSRSQIRVKLERRKSLKKDGGEMLVAIALDKPLAAVKSASRGPYQTDCRTHANSTRQASASGPCSKSQPRCA